MGDGPAAGQGAPGADGHDEGHALLIASLLDRDDPMVDRTGAEHLLATCTACAELHADLIMLMSAARKAPVPARPRDFRLTPADVLRLAPIQPVPGEPRRTAARLTGEMHVPTPDHGRHDRLLIVSLLDRGADSAERRRAEALIAACTDCAALHQDLLLLRDATRDLPTPPRTHEFTLSSDDAARQRRTGWRRLVAAFGSTRDVFSRPLAIGLTTIGLAGLLVTTASGFLSTGGPTALSTIGQATGGAGAATESIDGAKLAPDAASQASAAPPVGGAPAAALPAPTAAAPTEAPLAVASAAPSAESFDTFAGPPAGSGGAAPVAPEPGASGQRDLTHSTAEAAMDAPGASTDTRFNVIVVAGLLLLVGLALFALRWAARRI